MLTYWGKRRGTIPQPPQSQCGILPIELLSPSIHPQPCVPLQLARGFSVLVHDLKGTRSGGKNWSRTNTLWFFRPARLDRLSYLPIFGVGKLDFNREISPSHLVLFVVDWHIAHSCKLYPIYTEPSLSRFEPLRKAYFSTRVETFATPCHGRLNGWYFLTGSNRRLQTCKDCTLPTELRKYKTIVFPISQEVDYAVLMHFHTYPRGTFHNLYTTRLCSLMQVCVDTYRTGHSPLAVTAPLLFVLCSALRAIGCRLMHFFVLFCGTREACYTHLTS